MPDVPGSYGCSIRAPLGDLGLRVQDELCSDSIWDVSRRQPWTTRSVDEQVIAHHVFQDLSGGFRKQGIPR